MEAAALQSLLDKAQRSGQTELKFSEEETDRFKNAFESKEFRDMFASYLEEIQDPAARKENEAYIAQLEKEDKVPAGKELIRPSPVFVVKTHKSSSSTTSASSSPGDKVFINIVESPKISAPTSTSSTEGSHWSVPYSIGPPHMEKDRSDCNVAAYDCCFHPDAVLMSTKHSQFKRLLMDTALDGVESACQRQGVAVKLARENVRQLKGVRYMRGQVLSMLIDTDGAGQLWGKNDEDKTKASSSNDTSSRGRETTTPTPGLRRGFLNKTVRVGAGASGGPVRVGAGASGGPVRVGADASGGPTRVGADASGGPARVGADASGGPAEPSYSVVERGAVSMGDLDGLGGRAVKSTRPAELVCRIHLPLLQGGTQTEAMLDVSDRALSLVYRDVYALSIKLPYPVLEKLGSAKYDKQSKSLVVTLPVQPHADVMVATESETMEEAEKSIEEAEEPIEEAGHEAAAAERSFDRPNHSRWVESSVADEADGSRLLREEVKELARRAMEEAEASGGRDKDKDEDDKDCKDDDDDEVLTFRAAASFAGSRRGCVFKLGQLGLGYYRDVNSSSARVDSSSAHVDSSSKSVDSGSTVPVFEYRETEASVVIIIQVRDIISESVAVLWSGRTARITFLGGERGSDCYGAYFECAGDVDTTGGSFDVAAKNMVMVIKKTKEGMWGSSLHGAVRAVAIRELHPGALSEAEASRACLTETVAGVVEAFGAMTVQADLIFALD